MQITEFIQRLIIAYSYIHSRQEQAKQSSEGDVQTLEMEVRMRFSDKDRYSLYPFDGGVQVGEAAVVFALYKREILEGVES